jgi:hypothetical protein
MKTISLKTGHLIEVGGIALGVTTLYISNIFEAYYLKIFFLSISWFCFLYFTHCLTHYIVGYILKIKFKYYFIGAANFVSYLSKKDEQFNILKKLPVLGIKIDIQSLIQVKPIYRMIMFQSGAIASMIFPLIVPIYSMKNSSFLISIFFFIISIMNIAFDLYYSPKTGDFKKAKKWLIYDMKEK